MCSLLMLVYVYYFSLSEDAAVLNECTISEDLLLVIKENKVWLCQSQYKKKHLCNPQDAMSQRI
jgi:hypothetical protein